MQRGNYLVGASLGFLARDLEKRRSSRCPVGFDWSLDWLCVQTWKTSETARLIKNRLLSTSCTSPSSTASFGLQVIPLVRVFGTAAQGHNLTKFHQPFQAGLSR